MCHAIDVVIAPGIVGADEEHFHPVEVAGLEVLFLEYEAEAAHTVWDVRCDEGDISGQARQVLCFAHALVAASDDGNGSTGEGKSDGKIIQGYFFLMSTFQ